ncbi:MAG: MaoC family dehydratase N-terminal domain-containing protein [Chloroflexi bacterium]|nr:MaoC family dehydratase N-terminal domain-containing protein [Chloroflexota bacterium]
MSFQPRGKYLQDFQVGQEIVSAGRTITETDLVNFAALTWDTNPMHTDAEYGKTTLFGERIAHGMLGLSYAIGLVWQIGVLEGTVIAFRGLEMKFKGPLKIGDTMHVVAQVVETKPIRNAGGIVVIELRVLNQRDEVSYQGTMTVLVKGRGEVITSAK